MPRSTFLGLSFTVLLAACSVDLAGLGNELPHDDSAPSASAPSTAMDPSLAPGSVGSSANPAVAPGLSSSSGASAPQAPAEDSGLPNDPAATPTLVDAGAGSVAPVPVDAGAGAVTTPPVPGLVLTSPAFTGGQLIPRLHTCQGKDESPAFEWSYAPADTHSFAFVLTTRTKVWGNVVGFTRWVIWNIPGSRVSLPMKISEGSEPANVPGARQASDESDSNSSGGGTFGSGYGAGGAFGSGGSAAVQVSGAGGSFAGVGAVAGGVAGIGGGVPAETPDPNAGRRYRGPCSYGFSQTFEFTLYALGAAPAVPEWGTSVTTETVVSWIETKAKVLAEASLNGVSQ